MTMKYLLAGLLLSGSAMAALSPFNQRLAEITKVAETVEDAVQKSTSSRGSGVIDSIVHAKDDGNKQLYAVRSGRCSIVATVKYLPPTPGMVGPAQFEVEAADDMSCRKRPTSAASESE